MTFAVHICVFGTLIVIASATSEVLNKPDCEEFSKGVVFNESEAVGTWYLLHYRTQKKSGSGTEALCLAFSIVTDEERKTLIERIGKNVNGLKWGAVTLKMQIPCATAQSNNSRLYWLEKIQSNGEYRNLQTPPLTAKTMPSEYHLYPMRLKIIEEEYLGMMDCNEKFVFMMGRHPPQPDKPLEERIAKLMQQYWPEGH